MLILEDDVQVSPAYFAFLADAYAEYGGGDGVAGVSLQRQAYRLDATARELGDPSAAPNALAPLPLPNDDGLYLFPHVGPWGFAPEPAVWEAFRAWFRRLDDADAETHFSVGRDGTPWRERGDGYRENLVTRWYRRALNADRGDVLLAPKAAAMWTAHFDAFCAQRGLGVLHARAAGNGAAFAASSRAVWKPTAGSGRPTRP